MNTPNIVGLSNFKILRESTFYSIWTAHHDSLDRTVEVHQLQSALSTDQSAHQMRMIRIVSKLDHASIPNILDINATAEPPFFICDHAASPSLSDLVEKNGVFSMKDALRVAGKVAETLAYISTQSPIVIRNLKPQNILFEENGSLKLTDYSLAIVANDDADGPAIDGDDIVGTPNFVSPEHADGKLDVDQRSDMYSLGAVLYYLTTRKVPFDCDDVMKVLELQKVGQVPSPREFNPSLSAQFVSFLSRLMMKDPLLRYATWGEVLADIRRLQSNLPLSAHIVPKGAVSTILVPTPIPTNGADLLKKTKSAVDSPKPFRTFAWLILVLWLAWLANCRLANPLGLPEKIAPTISIPFLDKLFDGETPDESAPVQPASTAEQEVSDNGNDSVETSVSVNDDNTNADVTAQVPASAPNTIMDPLATAYADLAKQIGDMIRCGDVKSAYDRCAQINSVAANEVVKLLDGIPAFDVAAADAIMDKRGSTIDIIFMGKKRSIEPISFANSKLRVKFKNSDGIIQDADLEMRKIDESQKLELISNWASTAQQHSLVAIMALKLGDNAIFARHASQSGALAKLFEAMK